MIKAFNNIYARHLLELGRPKGTPGRIALPVAGDDAAAKDIVLELVDELGFDGVDAGGLDESWRQQPGTPVYIKDSTPKVCGVLCPRPTKTVLRNGVAPRIAPVVSARRLEQIVICYPWSAKVKRLHLVVRGEGLEASMSRYLIDRIAALPNIELHTHTEVMGLEGDEVSGLTGAVFRDRKTGATHSCSLRHLFLFIGADPNAAWLEHCVAVDDKGFVVTGVDFTEGTSASRRAVLPLETSQPGVFAIGDVRAGSTKRVAAAVGEGAAVVAQIHSVLAAEP